MHSLAALVCRPSIAVQYALWQLEMLLSFMPRLTRLEGALIHVADQPGAADASASGHGHGYGIGNGNSASGENTPEPLGKRLHSIVSRLSTRGSVYALSLSVPSKAWSSVAHHGPYLCTPALILSLLDLHATEAENVQHARNVAAVFPNLTTLMVRVSTPRQDQLIHHPF